MSDIKYVLLNEAYFTNQKVIEICAKNQLRMASAVVIKKMAKIKLILNVIRWSDISIVHLPPLNIWMLKLS